MKEITNHVDTVEFTLYIKPKPKKIRKNSRTIRLNIDSEAV
jgi:hypothetical protein